VYGDLPFWATLSDVFTHIAEEAKDSSYNVPITLLIAYTSNVLLGFFAVMSW
jgi:hypothetical protein